VMGPRLVLREHRKRGRVARLVLDHVEKHAHSSKRP
jgi:hypothetical protein